MNHVEDYVCTIAPNAGQACGPKSTRWYFNAQTQLCSTFELSPRLTFVLTGANWLSNLLRYLGCDGNPNNFPSQDFCQEYCGINRCPYGGTPHKGMCVQSCGYTVLSMWPRRKTNRCAL